VKLGKAVSEGDQLWSAVENFAGPLGLVKPSDARYLDPSASRFYRAIKEKVEGRGGAGLEVRTVYNWFTGYDPKDGQESPGLTRRMVDVYLIAMAQQGVIRISDKRGGWIDRATVAAVDFKPETLRNLARIELPKTLEDWPLFSPYLEVLTGKVENALGPKYDKATADVALVEYWEKAWLKLDDLRQTEENLRELFRTLDMEKENRFEDILIYWTAFADEPRPAACEIESVFDALRRAVITVAGVDEPGKLTSAHLTAFKDNYRQLRDLRASFEATRSTLLRSARLGRAQLAEPHKGIRDVARAQSDVLSELNNVNQLVVSPDTVHTRLQPRLEKLEQAYVPAYLDELIALDSVQTELETLAANVGACDEIRVLKALSVVPESKQLAAQALAAGGSVALRLRRKPEDRDAAAREVREHASVKDVVDGSQLSMRRLVSETALRAEAREKVKGAPRSALHAFAGFVRSPTIWDRLKPHEEEVKIVANIRKTKSAPELADILLAAGVGDLAELANVLMAVAGEKTPKTVKLESFKLKNGIIWEKDDIRSAAAEFQSYLESVWEDGKYLKLED